jgi:hypothetical protein
VSGFVISLKARGPGPKRTKGCTRLAAWADGLPLVLDEGQAVFTKVRALANLNGDRMTRAVQALKDEGCMAFRCATD